MQPSNAVFSAVRRRRSRSEVLELIRSFEQSGQSLREYCRLHGLSKSSLSAMLRRHDSSNSVAKSSVANRHKHSDATTIGFAPIDIVPSRPSEAAVRNSSLVIEMRGGIRVHLDRNFDEVTFGRLLSLLNKA